MAMPVEVVKNAAALAESAAKRVTSALAKAIDDRDRATLVLAGGSTPAALYRLLAKRSTDVDWQRVDVFWGDERCVPPEDESSNFGAAKGDLLEGVKTPRDRIHRIQGELWPPEAAVRYEAELERVFGGPPRFDVVLLGMGDDGHTASLFPGSPALLERHRQVVSTLSPKPPATRVTLTLPTLESAELVLFLVSGAGKAEAMAATRSQWTRPLLPAARVRPTAGELLWLVDQAAWQG